MPKFSISLKNLERLIILIGVIGCAAAIWWPQFLISKSSWWLSFNGEVGDYTNQVVGIRPQAVLGSDTGCIYVTSRNSSLICLSPKTGNIQWETTLPEPSSQPPQFLPNSSILIVSTEHGGLVGIDKTTGLEIWRFKHPLGAHWVNWSIEDGGPELTILGLDRKDGMYCLSAQTGQVIWFKPSKQSPVNNTLSPALFANSWHIPLSTYFTDEDRVFWGNFATNDLIALDKTTGKEIWRKNDFSAVETSDLFVFDQTVIYRDSYQRLTGVDRESGRSLFIIPILPETKLSKTPTALVAATYPSSLVWYDGVTGKQLQKITTPGLIEKVWFDKQLYARLFPAPYHEKLVKIDSVTGEIIWSSAELGLIHQILSLPNETLVVTSSYGKIFWLAAQTGKTLTEVSVVGDPTFSLSASPTDFNTTDPVQSIWVLSKHAGNVGTDYLTDITLITQPGVIKNQWRDLKIDSSTAIVKNQRLWVASQDKTHLFSAAYFNNPLETNYYKIFSQPQERKSQLTWWKNWQRKLYEFKEWLIIQFKTQPKLSTFLDIEADSCMVTWQMGFDTTIKNPWIDSRFSVKLTPPTGASTETEHFASRPINSFYYQNTTWQAKAALPESGEWHWTASIGPSWLRRQQSGVLVMPETCRWNFLKNDSTLGLTSATGQPFFGVGLQDQIKDFDDDGLVLDQWVVGQSIQPIPKNTTIPVVHSSEYLKTFAEAGFSIFRLGFDNFSYQPWYQLNETGFRGSVLKNQWTDELLTELRTNNYHVVLSIFGFKPVMDSQAVEPYLDYLINRFGPYVDVWELSNEAWPTDEWVESVAAYFKTHDPYHHPVTINWERSNLVDIDASSLHYYRSEPWPELDHEYLSKLTTASRWNKGLIVSELGNSGSNWDPDSADRNRVRAWLSAWHHTPVIFWNQGADLFEHPLNSNVYLGPTERQHMRTLSDWLKTYKTETFESIDSSDLSQSCYGQTNHTNLLLLYCLNRQRIPQSVSLPMENWLKQAKLPTETDRIWEVRWFEPKTGQLIRSEQVSNNKYPLTPIFTTDLVGEWRLLPR